MKWIDFDIIAPLDAEINTKVPSKEEKEIGKLRLKKAADLRLKKVKNFYNEDIAKSIIRDCKDKEKVDEILKLSRGNFHEVKEFILSDLSYKEKEYKEEILKSLSIKDLRDFKSSILLEHLKSAIKFTEKYHREIFKKYILNPRIHIETLTKYRDFIEDYFTEDEKMIFCENPKEIWKYIDKNIEEKEEYEYKGTITSPVGLLKGKIGNKISKKVLFVAICRSLGIPARINDIDGLCEFYNEVDFKAVEMVNRKSSILKISSKSQDINWIYFSNWSIAKLENGVYKSLNLIDVKWNNGIILNIEAGHYRIITSNRLPNGNIFGKRFLLIIGDNETKDISLELRKAEISDILEDIQIMDFNLKKENGEIVKAKDIIKGRKHLILWLEESREPTEHILNEIYERKDEFNTLGDSLILIVKDKDSLKDPTISKIIKALDKVQIYYDDFFENVNLIGRRMYVDPDKLPLILITDENFHGVYATSGYNVGTGDMLLRILMKIGR